MKTGWNSKKTILIFIDWYLPGYKAGGPIKSVSSIVNYLKADFNFFIITTNTDFGADQPYAQIEADKWMNTSESINIFYASKKFLTVRNLLKLMKSINFDLIYLNSFFSLYFSILPLTLYKMGLIKSPILLAPRGMLGKGALELKIKKKQLFISISKFMALHKNIYWQATSVQEKAEIEEMFGKKLKLSVVPNLQYNDSNLVFKTPFKNKGEVKLFFLSRISPKKNLLFALQLLARLKNISGNIEYYIIGPVEDIKYWESCKEVIKTLPANVQVFYKGAVTNVEVAEKISPFHFLFLPTLNENYGHAIVESFINGKPVVISDQTPWNDLNVYKAGWDIPLKNVEIFIEVIKDCLNMDNVTYLKLSGAAIYYAKEKCLNTVSIDNTRRMFTNTFVS